MIGRCKRNGTGRKPQKPKNDVTLSSEHITPRCNRTIQSHCSNKDLTTRRESQENVGELKSLFERMSKSPNEIKTRYENVPLSHHHGQPRLTVVNSR